jgi:hypothetical protein
MRKARFVAFGVALVSVSLMTTPAFAETIKFRDKDAVAFVTNCKFDHAGERCLVYGIFADISIDPFSGRSATLELDKYRIKVLDTSGNVDVNFVAAGIGHNVQMSIANDLSRATGGGSVGSLTGGKVKVSFSVTGNSDLFTSRSKQVFKIGDCVTEIDRSNGKTRFGDHASAVIDGVHYAWNDVLAIGGAPIPEIDKSASTTIINNCV